MDFSTMDILAHAETGNIEPLARHLEDGGDIGVSMRKFLAAHLRGELDIRPGNKRTLSQIEMECAVCLDIIYKMQMHDCSEYRAIEMYLDENPKANRETVRGYLKKQRRRVRKGG